MDRNATLRLLLRVVFGLFLLLLGWGWDDLGGFFTHPARSGFFVVAVISTAVALLMRLDVQVFRKGKGPVGRQPWLLAALTAVGLFLILFLPYADRRGVLTFADGGWLRYVGLLLLTVGTAVVLVALRSLGKQYSGYITLQDDHKLVQTSIYGLIRHPIYLRALLVSVGLPLIFRSWVVAPLFVFICLFVYVRIRQEEELLAERFGVEFEAYCRRTWRLIPYLY
ncbi:MAG: methyltransferase family protein [Candidatus Methylomirabilales bacterium]